LRADEGDVEIDGRARRQPLRSRAIAYLSHLPALKADLGAREPELPLRPAWPAQGAADAGPMRWRMVGLAGYEDTLARQLSAGQKKRLSLARLWLSPAPLWLLDEPYANLDLEGINLVNRMISGASARRGRGAAHHAWRLCGATGGARAC
jgi:heme exporter protein A